MGKGPGAALCSLHQEGDSGRPAGVALWRIPVMGSPRVWPLLPVSLISTPPSDFGLLSPPNKTIVILSKSCFI